MKKIFSSILLCSLILAFTGCGEDYLEKSPTTSVSVDDLFSTVQGAETAMNGMHRSMYQYYGNHGRFGQKSIDIAIDFMGEDFLQLERGYGWFVTWYQYTAPRTDTSLDLEFAWSFYYDLIDNANLIILYIDGASDAGLYETDRKKWKGQAYAYRAFAYYQLVQMFAKRYEQGGSNTHLGVPLVLDDGGERLPRAAVADVYAQINRDLDESITLLDGTPRDDKSHINVDVAKGLKARVALTTGDYATAATMANQARQKYALTPDYMNGWADASDSEWMWASLLIDEHQTSYASFFSHIDPLFGGYATLGSHKLGSTEIIDYMGENDQRRLLFEAEKFFTTAQMASYFSNKERVGWKFSGYGEWTNDYLYMKSGEMYLIEAEALARQSKDSEAQDVIFALTSNRDPDAVKPTVTGEALIQHILMERRCDLWGDGFRLFDIKRLNIALDRRNKGHNDTFWNGYGYLEPGDKRMIFLIPKQELDANPNMVQNET